MGHYKGYSEADYKQLLDALVKVKGKFLLSSYPSTILSQYIKKYKWKIKKVEKSVAVTKHTDKKKTEMLVMNYDPAKIKPIVQTVAPNTKNISVKNLESKLKRLKFAA
jgi:mannose/fructose/N-acetylgalactosamine-specific phosphotransferase system component IIB